MPPATTIPRFIPHAGRMVRASAAQAKDFKDYLSEMDFAQELASGVVPYAHDPEPPRFKAGRKADGWRFLFEVDTDKRERSMCVGLTAGYNNGLGNVHGAAQSWLVDKYVQSWTGLMV